MAALGQVGEHAEMRVPRQERSAARRAAILDAAAAVMTESGLDAMTYREVAGRARVPFSSIGYYFASIEDLIAATGAHLEHLRGRHAAKRLQEPGPLDTPVRVAELIVEVQLGERRSDEELQGTYTWLIQAGRHALLAAALRAARPALDAQIKAALELAGFGHFPVERALNVVDGAVVLSLIEGHPKIARRATKALAELLAESGGRA